MTDWIPKGDAISLHETLIDIGHSQLGNIPTAVAAGPNDWDNIEPSDFGPEHDFEVDNQGNIFIFTAVSEAAKQWCYKHLPEDCQRWGVLGFVIEHRYIADIVTGARRDGLMALEDYEQAMNENDDLSHQGEDS